MNDDAAAVEEVLAYQTKELKWFLSHEGVQRAFHATEQRITKEWERGQDPLTREMMWHKLQAFRTLKSELQALSQR